MSFLRYDLDTEKKEEETSLLREGSGNKREEYNPEATNPNEKKIIISPTNPFYESEDDEYEAGNQQFVIRHFPETVVV